MHRATRLLCTTFSLCSLASADNAQLGLLVLPMPAGGLEYGVRYSGFTETSTEDAAFAVGVAPFFDYLVTRSLSVGLQPQVTFNVRREDYPYTADAQPGTEFDLLVRLAGWLPASESLRLYGYLAPGYSIVRWPDQTTTSGRFPGDTSTSADGASGPVLQIAGGIAFGRGIFGLVQVGSQLGFQSADVMGESVALRTHYFQLAGGLGARF